MRIPFMPQNFFNEMKADVEEYLKFMSQHKSLIQHKFSAEHKQILHLLNFNSLSYSINNFIEPR